IYQTVSTDDVENLLISSSSVCFHRQCRARTTIFSSLDSTAGNVAVESLRVRRGFSGKPPIKRSTVLLSENLREKRGFSGKPPIKRSTVN
ncbi:hypothetical protein PMAYCL1PPCAC_04581, partial [Pristionchus mayeri]